jgi:Druantia protein DruA
MKGNEIYVVSLKPLLVETLIDRQQFHGGCYRASNWIELGETTGRGRMDRANKLNGARVKTILVYPLVKDAVHQLRDVNHRNKINRKGGIFSK